MSAPSPDFYCERCDECYAYPNDHPSKEWCDNYVAGGKEKITRTVILNGDGVHTGSIVLRGQCRMESWGKDPLFNIIEDGNVIVFQDAYVMDYKTGVHAKMALNFFRALGFMFFAPYWDYRKLIG